MLITMSDKEFKRTDVIRDVCEKRLKQKDAAGILDLTVRQISRLVHRFRQDGPSGLVSQKRGRPGNRKFSLSMRDHVMGLIHRHYADFGPTLANEKLKEHHGISISVETLRQWMIIEDLWVPRSKRRTKVYQPRHRRDCVGELVQIDGSHHDWFEGRSEKCCLLVYVDDASGKLMALHFCESESTYDYMLATRQYVESHGKPVAFYSDKHSVFRSSNRPSKTLPANTQFGRALYELNIELICANTSQAKGRVERMNKTLQDRLVKEMRLANINNIEEANAWLPEFISQFNRRFVRVPANPKNLHMRLTQAQQELDDTFAWQESRTVSNSLTLQYDKVVFLLDPTEKARSLIRKKVMIFDYPDGTITIKHCGVDLSFTIFDKLQEVNQAEIVENKRLGAALAFAKKKPENANEVEMQ